MIGTRNSVKRIVVISIAALSLLNSCKKKDEFNINGKVENAGPVKKVLLYEMDQLIDSAFINESNEFKFRRTSEDPNFYTILIGEKNFLVVAKNGEDLDFKTDLNDASNTYEVKGSEDSEKIREFNKISNDYGKVYQQIQEEYSKLMNSKPEAKDSITAYLMPKFQKNVDAYSKETLKFGDENKDNLAGFYAVGTLDQIRYESELIKYAENIKSKFPKNKAVQSFVEKMMAAKPVAVGQQAPDFELTNPEGKLVKLSDFKGKYILLDFWASWCAPCRQENPNIVKQYQAFKDKKFTVLGVSLDKNKNAWMRAIQDDKLSWTHVSELKEWDGEVSAKYRVEGIPASFILDPSGKIISKNLKGAELEAFLSKTLN